MRRGKGRPPAPFNDEQLAIATYLVNQGMTFKAAAEAGVIFYEYEQAQKLAAYRHPLRQNQRILPRLHQHRFSIAMDTPCPRNLTKSQFQFFRTMR